ncbi:MULTISPECIES: SCP2 sterol-binding domain-containing protein [Actibacterium]|uniref:Putative sterol carrier protein n=1 Tax=Actibacterium naphthalenivorans TaxID=1614693 RepID=A0A840CKV2_9RHOB|nr:MULTISPECIES: SCP2 sterol-binding domain-containing protein [Actibacterium]ALG90978.1 sterol carrier family protein [Actibacterium sp. EMB200-NS6]MBB4023356.1 putative sterol carrier protein [Actibacterium naphthalenivorans]
MSDVIDAAVKALSEKIEGGIDGSVKFVIEGEGAVYLDEDGVRAGDDDADVTLSADLETFQAMLAGDVHPTAAFMTGKLTIDGDMGKAMKLGAAFG